MKRFHPSAPNAKPEAELERPLVLYVEDEDANWLVTQRVLASRYDLHRARNATEALRALHDHAYRVILMDIQLVDSALDGLQLVRLLRGDPTITRPAGTEELHLGPVPPIIFVTAYAARYSREDLMRAGGDDVVTKPIDLIKLHLAITRCMTAVAKKALDLVRTPIKVGESLLK
jgi:CheY-like chemotaxis protein